MKSQAIATPVDSGASARPVRRFQALDALPGITLVVLCVFAFQHTVDDAYISFRYSEHFAAGHGLVFNPGQRVEGFSNPLWVYLLTIPALLGVDLTISGKLLGIAASLATLELFSRILERHFRVETWVRRTAGLVLAGHISIVYYAVSGLETSLYTLLVVLLHYALLENKYLLAAVAAGLAAICRPEGAMLVASLGAGLALAREPRRALPYVLVALGIVGIQLAFRIGYYGKLLPNTFYAKATVDRDVGELLLHHTGKFIRGSLVWGFHYLAGGLLAVAALIGSYRHWRVHPPMLLTIALLAFFIWYSVFDWMAFGRFYLPLLPLVLLYAFAALNEAGIRLRTWHSRLPLIAGALLVLAGWGVTARALSHLPHGEVYQPAMSANLYMDPAEYLRQLGQPGDTVAAPEIGILAYHSKLRMLDLLGLTDDKIPSMLGSHEKYHELKKENLKEYASYVLGQRPRFVVLYFHPELGLDRMEPIYASLYDEMTTSGTHSLGKTFRLNSRIQLAIFTRKDTAVSSTIE